jgi:hypothetical protein
MVHGGRDEPPSRRTLPSLRDERTERRLFRDLLSIAIWDNFVYSFEALIKHHWRRETGL